MVAGRNSVGSASNLAYAGGADTQRVQSAEVRSSKSGWENLLKANDHGAVAGRNGYGLDQRPLISPLVRLGDERRSLSLQSETLHDVLRQDQGYGSGVDHPVDRHLSDGSSSPCPRSKMPRSTVFLSSTLERISPIGFVS